MSGPSDSAPFARRKLRPGELVGERFQVVAAVAEGGMGIVYRARDQRSGQNVALKLVIHDEDPMRAERFRREVMVLSALRHPNIVAYVDHGPFAYGASFLAMEWLEGRDLGAVIREGTLDEDSTLVVATQLCDALAAAHTRGVIHRDVKPSNVVLVEDQIDQARVVDFGLVRLGEAPPMQTRDGTLVGTPAFIAPEQARGEDSIDARADLYSLGAVLFTCLVGKSPFAGNHVLAVLSKLLLEPAPRVSDFRADVSPEMDDLIARLLAKEPAERPSSAGEVKSLLSGSRPAIAVPQPASGRALSHGEQSFFSVLMIESTGRVGDDALPAALIGEAERYHAQIHQLADGALVAVFATDTTPTEMSTLAARYALLLHGAHPGTAMAVATGRGRLDERAPVGEVIDRAVALLLTDDGAIGDGGDRDVLVDAVTAGLIQERFRLREVGGGAYALGGEATQPHASHQLLGKQTACVGRDRELMALGALLDECVDESSPRAALVTGPVGAGKSRLAHELVERLRGSGGELAVWTAYGDPMRSGASYDLLGQLVTQALGIDAAALPDERMAQIRARVSERLDGPQCGRVAAFLGEILATPFPDDDMVVLREARRDPRLMYDQTLQAWTELLVAETARRPILCVLDDLQWSDLATVRFIDAALRALEDRGFMVLALARPDVHERFPDLWRDFYLERMPLRPLGSRACAALAREVLGDDVDREVIKRLVQRSEGNPFYMEELIRGAASGQLDQLPDTILATASARLLQVGAADRRVLRAASVFGNRFWKGAVAALLDETEAVVGAHVTTLLSAEFIVRCRESRFRAQDEYRFRHDVLRQAAYATLTHDDHVRAHHRAGRWLEEAGEPDPIVLANHYTHGEAPELALPWFCRAAEQALEANDMAAVIERVERAIECGAEGATLGSLRLLQAEAHNWSAEPERALSHALEAMQRLPERDDGWANAAHQIVWASSLVGDVDQIEEVAEQLQRNLSASPSDAYLASMAICAANLVVLKRFETAVALRMSITTELAARTPGPLVIGTVARMQGIWSAFDARWGDTAAFMRQAVDIWQELGNQRSACNDEVNLGSALVQLGAYEESIDVLRRCLARARHLGLNMRVFCDSALAIALMRSGERGRAAELLAGLLELEGNLYMRAMCNIYRAQLCMLEGDADGACAQVETALEDVDKDTYANVYAFAMAVRAEALLRLSRDAEALAAAERGMEVLESIGLLDEGDALLRLVHAEALHVNGRRDEARRAVARARDKLMAQAAAIEEPRWRQSFIERVAEHRRLLALARAWSVDD